MLNQSEIHSASASHLHVGSSLRTLFTSQAMSSPAGNEKKKNP